MSTGQPARSAARPNRAIILTALVVVSTGSLAFLLVRSSTPSPPELRPSSVSAAAPIDSPHVDQARMSDTGAAVDHRVTVFDDSTPTVAQLDPDLLVALREAATDAAREKVEFLVNSGWRSPERQKQLLREAVTKYGSRRAAARWVASAKTSPHVSGHAIDIGHSDATAWLSRHGSQYGLCQIYRNEPWHYELRANAIDHGCPAMYADPAHDPRMLRDTRRSKTIDGPARPGHTEPSPELGLEQHPHCCPPGAAVNARATERTNPIP